MAKFKYPFPKGSGSLDATTFSMPKRELGSRIVSHQALYNKSVATGKRLSEQHSNEPNAIKRSMIGHSAIKQSLKTRAIGKTLKGLHTMQMVNSLKKSTKYGNLKNKGIDRKKALQIAKTRLKKRP
jgi:hypothetical protein|tara:strand:+ start:1154 stop:1531 length:378 start_codon:yes stop_codon:yes gene_type:complete